MIPSPLTTSRRKIKSPQNRFGGVTSIFQVQMRRYGSFSKDTSNSTKQLFSLLLDFMEGCLFLRYPDLAKKLGEYGYECVKEEFLITRNLRRYLLLFDACLSHPEKRSFIFRHNTLAIQLTRAFCVVRKLSAHAGFPKGRKIFTPGRISI